MNPLYRARIRALKFKMFAYLAAALACTAIAIVAAIYIVAILLEISWSTDMAKLLSWLNEQPYNMLTRFHYIFMFVVICIVIATGWNVTRDQNKSKKGNSND